MKTKRTWTEELERMSPEAIEHEDEPGEEEAWEVESLAIFRRRQLWQRGKVFVAPDQGLTKRRQ